MAEHHIQYGGAARVASVLLVDDDLADATLIREAIVTAAPRVAVHVARTARQAMEMLVSEKPQLVLLDLNMAGTSGFNILQAIRNSDDFAHMPVVVLTTSAAQVDVDTAYQNGANAFISKPADLHSTVELMWTTIDFWIRRNA